MMIDLLISEIAETLFSELLIQSLINSNNQQIFKTNNNNKKPNGLHDYKKLKTLICVFEGRGGRDRWKIIRNKYVKQDKHPPTMLLCQSL